MTHAEFYDELKTLRQNNAKGVRWRINPGNELRCSDKAARCMCPITYLVKCLVGYDFDIGNWESAAKEVNLDEPIEIVNAADLIPNYDPGIRDELLAAVGILTADDGGDAGVAHV